MGHILLSTPHSRMDTALGCSVERTLCTQHEAACEGTNCPCMLVAAHGI